MTRSDRFAFNWLPFACVAALSAAAGCGRGPVSPPSTPSPAPTVQATGKPQFVDIAREVGISFRNQCGNPGPKPFIVESMGSGVAFLDYDGDGDMDLYFANSSTFTKDLPDPPPRDALYRNDGAGTFTNVTREAGLGDAGWTGGVAVGDIDNDGDPDIFLSNIGPNVLYRNNGDGTFNDMSKTAGIDDPRYGSSACFLDYDLDGYLDLYQTHYVVFNWDDPPVDGKNNALCQWHGLKTYCGPRGLPRPGDALYHNKGDNTFEDVSEKAGIRGIPAAYGLGVVCGDLDGDGWPDIYTANDATPNFLFRNKHDGTFEEIGLIAGVAYSDRGKEQAGMGVDLGDYNNDGLFDLFVTNYSEDAYAVYRNDGDGLFVNMSFESGVAEITYLPLGWGIAFVDTDNNGWEDIFCVNGHVYPQADELTADTGMIYLQTKLLMENQANGRFRDISRESGPAMQIKKASRGAAFGDFDDDGDIDVAVNEMDDAASLLRNDGGNRNHWIKFWLVGRKGNRDAYDAKVHIQVDGMTDQHRLLHPNASYLSSSDPRLHFGLGDHDRVKRVVIEWPRGGRTELADLVSDRVYIVDEAQGIIDKRPFSTRP